MADALDRASAHARAYLDSAATRPVPPRVDADEIRRRLGGPLPATSTDPGGVIDLLGSAGDDGLMAIASLAPLVTASGAQDGDQRGKGLVAGP